MKLFHQFLHFIQAWPFFLGNKKAVTICDRIRNLNIEKYSWFWIKNSFLFPSPLGEGVPMNRDG